MHNTTQLYLMHTALIQEAILGESLLWNEAGQQWWWTDIESSALFASTTIADRPRSHIAYPEKSCWAWPNGCA